MGQSGTNGIDTTNGTQTHVVPGYEQLSGRVTRSTTGQMTRNYSHDQRYTYVNINTNDRRLNNFTGGIALRNIVTTADIEREVEVVEGDRVEQKGGLYFEHGYDAHTPNHIVTASGYENVDMDEVARILVNDPAFELKMTAHADTSGDTEKNQTLSENRLESAKALLIVALQREGLTEDEAKTLYDERVAPHSTIIALGETEGPVSTIDDVKHQGNRVVTFDLFSETPPEERVNNIARKDQDVDNHEHVVIINMGTRSTQKEMDFQPEKHERNLRSNQFSIADENTHFVFKIDEGRNLNSGHEFTVNYLAKSNLVADNTNFLIEHNEQGAVTSAYNFETGNIDISVDGDVAVNIKLPDNIDPAIIRVGQISEQGVVTISPLTNLGDVAPISEMRSNGERNALTNAADSIVQLSIDAKHLNMASGRNLVTYKASLEEYGFSAKLDEVFSELETLGVDIEPYKMLLTSQYANPDSALYNPDQVVFPFQTYQALYETEVNSGNIEAVEGVSAYDALLKKVETELAAVDDSTMLESRPGGDSNSAPGMKNN